MVRFISVLICSCIAASEVSAGALFEDDEGKALGEQLTMCAALYDELSDRLKGQDPKRSEYLSNLSNGAEVSAILLFEDASFDGRGLYDSKYAGMRGLLAISALSDPIFKEQMQICVKYNELQTTLVEYLRNEVYKK